MEKKPYTNCYRTPVGKVLGILRVEYGETVPLQGKRLGYSGNYIALISAGKRGYTYDFYKSVMEHYSPKAEQYKDILLEGLLGSEVSERFNEVLPDITIEQKVYILYGIKE